MNYTTIPPPPHLKDLVQSFWALESHPGEIAPRDYFLLADSCPEIIFQYNDGFKSYSGQSARMRFQHSVHDQFKVGKTVGFFGVRLYPHAVGQLLKMPASEVVNRVFDFSTLFGSDGENLADQVYNATDTLERIARVADFLTKRSALYKTDPIVYFVNQTVQRAGWVAVSEMQQESGLSVKQFERRFTAIAGFAPKYFARIARFQGVKDKFCSGRFKTLTHLAYSCNYYDQSHFNREFKEFSGMQPLQYFKLSPPAGTASPAPAIEPANAEQSAFDGYLPCGRFA